MTQGSFFLTVMASRWWPIFLLTATTSFINNNNKCEALSSAAVLETAKIAKMQKGGEKRPQVSFSHVHLYVDHLDDLPVYKDLEDHLNSFVKSSDKPLGSDIPSQQKLWDATKPSYFAEKDPSAFVPQNRDLVQQLLSGFGFRVTGARYAKDSTEACNTRSVLVTSKDPSGVQFLLTAKDPAAQDTSKVHGSYRHFDAGEPKKSHCAPSFFISSLSN